MDSKVFKQWLAKLETRDPAVFQAVSRRMDEQLANKAATLEATTLDATAGSAGDSVDYVQVVAESIIREGRPALFVADNLISEKGVEIDAGARVVVERLKAAAAKINPVIPLVGRIDVVNFPGSATFLGTAWLVDDDVVVTNRHVAELVARWDGGEYRFIPGQLGRKLQVSVGYLHEADSKATASVVVEQVIWIEADTSKADIAFLKVRRHNDGTSPGRVEIAEQDVAAGTDVAVIGYPARAPAEIIPDQAWMDRIFGSRYDVKRIAPGKMDDPSRGWNTHDCTTIGGNSGSVVVSMETGKAVGLHFAGLYMVENYAVPASMLRQYILKRPWQGARTAGGESNRSSPPSVDAVVRVSTIQQAAGEQTAAQGNSVSLIFPLTVSVSLGAPQTQTPLQVAAAKADVVSAARQFRRETRIGGVVKVLPGYVVNGGLITDQECVVVAADPAAVSDVKAQCPPSVMGHPVVVRSATIAELAQSIGALAIESASSTQYNDADRTGPEFSFDIVEEAMTVKCHVGPEQGWINLQAFCEGAKKFVSSMYQFHVKHIAAGMESALKAGASLSIVLDPHTRNDKKEAADEFNRKATFAAWHETFGARFDHIYVPKGSAGLVASDYHIKVTVRDDHLIWLSSGNWTHNSQPKVEEADLANPTKVSAMGNREWHVIIDNVELAKRFSSHIKADFAQSGKLGGSLEAVADEIYVDVPKAALQTVMLEAAATQLLLPLDIGPRKVRVKPLLTPDLHGKVFTDAVLELIESAKEQLVFQNQYINVDADTGGNLGVLVDALARKAKHIEDVRIVLRGSRSELLVTGQELKRRGFPDVNNRIRGISNTHTKGIVVDGKRVLIGSQNWSSLGVSLNRDASLIFDDTDIAGYFLGAFEIDWRRASRLADTSAAAAVSAHAPRLAVGEAPPAGHMRMTLSEYLEG
ncbi:phospholipase D-like domain-containing protein [Mesorhizobium sp. M0768]|uniref:phospholipase D-like domain-containing protein n=1 Tax=Mesorhizobium sp. M0768 TaxID=2956996 RepID=UPI00333BE0DD